MKPADLSEAEERLWANAEEDLTSETFEIWKKDFLFVRGLQWPEPEKICLLDRKYGERVCRDGMLWVLTYSDSAPPDQRQCEGPCPHCSKKQK